MFIEMIEDETISMTTKGAAEKAVCDIRRKTRKQYSAEEKTHIVLEGMNFCAETAPRTAHTTISIPFSAPVAC